MPTVLIRMRREVPADGRALPALIGVYAPGMGEKFSRTFRLGLETTDITPGSRAWEEEVRRTEEFIGRFIHRIRGLRRRENRGQGCPWRRE